MTFELHRNASLKKLNTFGVDARTAVLADVFSVDALPALFAELRRQELAWLVLGEGSNVLFVNDYLGAIVRPHFAGIDIVSDDGREARIRVGAGQNWHRFVAWSIDAGFGDLANLALIPGSVGAAPVQNIGAYGVELEAHVLAVEAFDAKADSLVRLDAYDCGFAYRDSRFKKERDRWLITAVEFSLHRDAPMALRYAGIREEIMAARIQHASPRDVFDAVCAIRRRKLPDPAIVGNAGSFFKNPVVGDTQAAFIRDHHPEMPFWPVDDGIKLSAAWLIEQAGLKGYREGDAGISDQHALVLVNHGNASGSELYSLAERVRDAVEARFGVRLEPEPRIIGV